MGVRARLPIAVRPGIVAKDVAVPFDAIRHETRDNKIFLTMDATKETLTVKVAPGFTYDRNTSTSVVDQR
jgi:hypothetical protein